MTTPPLDLPEFSLRPILSLLPIRDLARASAASPCFKRAATLVLEARDDAAAEEGGVRACAALYSRPAPGEDDEEENEKGVGTVGDAAGGGGGESGGGGSSAGGQAVENDNSDLAKCMNDLLATLMWVPQAAVIFHTDHVRWGQQNGQGGDDLKKGGEGGRAGGGGGGGGGGGAGRKGRTRSMPKWIGTSDTPVRDALARCVRRVHYIVEYRETVATY